MGRSTPVPELLKVECDLFFFLPLIPFLNICASIPFCRCYIRLLMAFVFRLSTASCGFFFFLIFVSGGRQQGESGLYSE